MSRSNKSSSGILAVAIIAALIVSAGTAFLLGKTLLGKKAEDLDLVSNISIENIKLSGYDGEGVVNIDNTELRELIYYNGGQDVKHFIETVTYTVNPSSNLKNGDKITIKADYDRTDARTAKVNITKDNITFTIGGLDDKPASQSSGSGSTTTTTPTPTPAPTYSDPYITMRVDTTYAPEQGGVDDGYAAVRTGPSTGSEYKTVGKIWEPDLIDVYHYSKGWYEIATGPWKGYYVHESSLVTP